jgi:hypothetical protein
MLYKWFVRLIWVDFEIILYNCLAHLGNVSCKRESTVVRVRLTWDLGIDSVCLFNI